MNFYEICTEQKQHRYITSLFLFGRFRSISTTKVGMQTKNILYLNFLLYQNTSSILLDTWKYWEYIVWYS